MAAMQITEHEREILATVRRLGPLSRQELHRELGRRPNTVGEIAGGMLDKRLLREGDARATSGPGRPHIPLEIDPAGPTVLGLALRQAQVGICRLNLIGETLEGPTVIDYGPADDAHLIDLATRMLHEARSPDDLAIGLSVPGFVDPQTRTILTSSAMPGHPSTGIEPLYDAAGGLPVVLENDMHALAACWSMTRESDLEDDLLLVDLDDGAIGAAMLIAGRPNRGCVVGGNELGHLRLAVDTARCYCGHTGCLERICSSQYLAGRDAEPGELLRRAVACDQTDQALRSLISHLAQGLANAINFIRPNRVVLTGVLASSPRFIARVSDALHGELFEPVSQRVLIETWPQRPASSAEVAGWLALASVYSTQWRAVTASLTSI